MLIVNALDSNVDPHFELASFDRHFFNHVLVQGVLCLPIEVNHLDRLVGCWVVRCLVLVLDGTMERNHVDIILAMGVSKKHLENSLGVQCSFGSLLGDDD